MLNFSLRLLSQLTKLIFRVGIVLGCVLLFSLFKLILDYFMASSEDEDESNITAEATRQSENSISGTMPSSKIY